MTPKKNYWFGLLPLAALAVLTIPATSSAEIMAIGNVDPVAPENWTSSTDGSIGLVGFGSITLDDGSNLLSRNGYLGRYTGSTGEVTIEGTDSLWNNSSNLCVGLSGSGTLSITDGAAVHNSEGHVSDYSGSTGKVTVDGSNSVWNNSGLLNIAASGNGTLDIINGGTVNNSAAYLSDYSGSTGTVTVNGIDSIWNNTGDLYIGHYGGSGTLEITNGGLVNVDGALNIDSNHTNNSFINMSTGGTLALSGEGEASLNDFYDLIYGTDAIRYWNGESWDSLTNAIVGEDYHLTYHSDGDLAGHTVLSVGHCDVPEPSTFALLATAVGGFLAYFIRRHR